jgi:uncharacterized protein
MDLPTIWIDADACPRAAKELIFRSSQRLGLPVVLVANQRMNVPQTPLVRLVQVAKNADAADSYIVAHLAPGDLAITADIPLAAQVLARGGLALDPRGELFSPDTIGERLATRNLLEELRWSGVELDGPSAYSAQDRQRFAAALDRQLTAMLRCRQS